MPNLVGRAIRRSPSLSDAERARMLEGLATIEAKVRVMVSRIDAISREGMHGAADAAGLGNGATWTQAQTDRRTIPPQ
jgi:hypothetical protein